MENKQLIITVAGQVASGKSRLTFLLKEFLKGQGFNVQFEGNKDFSTENEFDAFYSENSEKAIENIKSTRVLNLKELQLPRQYGIDAQEEIEKHMQNDILNRFNQGFMNLKDFIENFVESNTLIRLQYKTESGHEAVNGDNPEMEWKLKEGVYADRKVIGVTDILYPHSNYPDAVNITIERE